MRIEISGLVSYPPSCPNRDETNRPKTAVFGGHQRQRISSQSLKRAWRLSAPMQAVDASFSTRTRRLGYIVQERLLAAGMAEKLAAETSAKIVAGFGSPDKKDKLLTSEVVVLGPEELAAVEALLAQLAAKNRAPTEGELEALERPTQALDVALFGRMRADNKAVGVEATASVAHALTTNAVRIEDDFWTAVDDLNVADTGAAGMGEVEFGAGVYYVYAVVDVDALVKNLGGHREAAARGVEGLVEAIATVTPGGHRSTFAHHSLARYLRLDVGEQAPCSLMAAFEVPVSGREMGLTQESIERLEAYAEEVRLARRVQPRETVIFNGPAHQGSLNAVCEAARAAVVAGRGA
ncbi:MAG: type I-E CRISPR-associated protein Cas7/Cse4/CasC [Gammaproteobacteria bacterium]|nr:type I-E CRISPR-associated protein Cas7/Cse4/CasC [Gammaproteobacteria bacterium]